MNRVSAKKHLGQHFLTDRNIAIKMAGTLTGNGYSSVLEIGPGTGMLTSFLLEREFKDFRVIEIDRESVDFLKNNFSGLRIIEEDFLRFDMQGAFKDPLAITGNFPYNISSQILFRVLDNRDSVLELTGMFQKEMAKRVCAGPGSKDYGILSVLLSAYYKREYLFEVPPGVFRPPPKVKSAVIRLTRSRDNEPDCDEKLFFRVVKTVFNQRRKMIRNSLLPVARIDAGHPLADKRPEQMDTRDFYSLTREIEKLL